MKYAHIVKFVTETPWAILPAKLAEIEAILELHLAGGRFSAEELRARFGESPPSPTAMKRGAVAVLPLHGLIAHRIGGMSEMSGGVSTERFAAMFREAMADESISAIVLDIDSMGGTVPGVTELAGEIYEAKGRGTKRVLAHVNALAASAAYWIAASADEIIVTPSGSVGSVGVIAAHIDTSKADEQDGITRTIIAAGKHKAELDGPLSDEAKAAIQWRVDQAYAQMVRDIARGRGVTPATVREGYGEGRVVSAQDALAAGMIDRIATFEVTIARLLGRGGQSAGMRAERAESSLEAAGGANRGGGTSDAPDLDGATAGQPAPPAAAGAACQGDPEADRRRRLERF